MYTAYGPMNHKRALHFRRFETERGERKKKFLKIFPTRWANTVFQAITRFMEKYDTLLSHQMLIYEDEDRLTKEQEWTAKQHENAQQLYHDLTDENFLILVNLEIDVLSFLSTQSLIYQHSEASVIGEKLN